VPSGFPAVRFWRVRIVPKSSEAVRPLRLNGSPALKVSHLATDVADILEDAIGIVSVEDHEQVAGIDGMPAAPMVTQAGSNVDLRSVRRDSSITGRSSGSADDGLSDPSQEYCRHT